MAAITLRLLRNSESGRLEVHVGLQSEEDTLPFEHERDHKSVLRRLMPSLDTTFPPDAVHVVERESLPITPAPGCGGFDSGCGGPGGGYDDEYIEDHDPPF